MILYRIFDLFYNSFALFYRFFILILFGKKWYAWQIKSLSFVKKGISLEIGTAGWLSEINVAIDVSFSMLKYAKKVNKTTYFIQAKAEALPFKKESFLIVFCAFPTKFIFKSQTWDEIKRILKKDGTFICIPWIKMREGSLYYYLQRLIYGRNDFDFSYITLLAKEREFKVNIRQFKDDTRNTIYVLLADQ